MQTQSLPATSAVGTLVIIVASIAAWLSMGAAVVQAMQSWSIG